MRTRRRRPDTPAEPPDPATVRTAALRLLARRDYTSAELRHRLLEPGYPADNVDALIASLIADKWLDDRRVAGAHARTASRVKGRGKHRIRRELQARGLDAAAVRDAVAALPEGNDRDAIAKYLARKRVSGGISPAERRKLFQQLLRRGFDASDISKALRQTGIKDTDEN